MKVSVITVCYNSAATIRDTIESVLGQDWKELEYIVVDGASSDSTMSIVSEYSDRIARVISEPDKGIYDAMNKGIEAASGDVIGILNSDDVYADQGVISSVVATFDGGADLVFGDLVYVDHDDLSIVRRYYSSGHFRPWKLRFGWMPPHPATFVRAAAYRDAGAYSLDYKIAADYEMFVRLLLLRRLSFRRLPAVLVRMRMGGVSTKGIVSSWLLNREIVRACRSNDVYTNILLVLSKLPFKLVELLRRPKVA